MVRSAQHNDDAEPTTHQRWFGYRRVAREEKPALVRRVFENVADRYDLMNDIMSGGIHRLWKREMVDWLRPRPGSTILDVAGGTGDIALRIFDRLKGRGRIIVVDATPAMLVVGRDRMIDHGLLCGIDWVAGDAERLPVADSAVDAYAVAFGLRNVTDLDRALGEARRVLKPGGRFLCLEFSRVVVPVLDRLYDLYSFGVLPVLGQVVTADAASYRYLAESIRTFPAQEEFAARIGAAGFEQVRFRNLTGGIAALHSAWRL
ncbi:MAG TPA: bifunctional demethylmenaquinone methyltransferase/2-methoxy-6-polyprenyl-1,4-benzoquinol methylase UbiE [Alphaproteobacteria bacterium]|jgi:demethylmenaquinone methyltransferase/2-methoxy-6-polyprenyl-1,4-benzoquinol methylase|nr:bifunctional demethylmenaquinone methyltransferase/2-methoxy-6-polyprenyl-1,4-benzoquinol methylase UbiE [Alphaproteobacteria bacterium]